MSIHRGIIEQITMRTRDYDTCGKVNQIYSMNNALFRILFTKFYSVVSTLSRGVRPWVTNEIEGQNLKITKKWSLCGLRSISKQFEDGNSTLRSSSTALGEWRQIILWKFVGYLFTYMLWDSRWRKFRAIVTISDILILVAYIPDFLSNLR